MRFLSLLSFLFIQIASAATNLQFVSSGAQSVLPLANGNFLVVENSGILDLSGRSYGDLGHGNSKVLVAALD